MGVYAQVSYLGVSKASVLIDYMISFFFYLILNCLSEGTGEHAAVSNRSVHSGYASIRGVKSTVTGKNVNHLNMCE